MVNSYLHMSDVRLFHKKATLEFERHSFLLFEDHLLKFIADTHKLNKLVWLSPVGDTFININNMYLRRVDPAEPGKICNQDSFYYMGFENGFK